MSIDFKYKLEEDKKITNDYLVENISAAYEIVNVATDSNNVVTYFSINPKDSSKIIYPQKGYEFHLQEDGRYWHPILTRDDSQFEIENNELVNISSSLNLELDLD